MISIVLNIFQTILTTVTNTSTNFYSDSFVVRLMTMSAYQFGATEQLISWCHPVRSKFAQVLESTGNVFCKSNSFADIDKMSGFVKLA